MRLPHLFEHHREWTLVGPLGPQTPLFLEAHPVLAVDGGARFASRIDIWVGDGDSHAEAIDCSHKYEFSPHKSQSDLALALSLLSPLRRVTVHLWGFLGGRRDHELLNIGEALAFLEGQPNSRLFFYDDTGEVAIDCLGPGEWDIHREGLFSLASIKDVIIKMTGNCTYPIPEEITLSPLSSLGLSNWGHGDIHLLTQGAIMLFYGRPR